MNQTLATVIDAPDHAGIWVQATQLRKSSRAADKVFHPDLCLGADQADGAQQRSAQVVGLRAEDMIDQSAHGRLCPIAGLALFG